MKLLSKILLCAYLLVLLWLVLFKLSSDPISVLLNHRTRSLSLVPFADHSRANLREIIDNLVVFVPFGLLLHVNFKRANTWRKFAFVCAFSSAAEIIQFVFAIGVADITDVIANTLGGSFGLIGYSLGNKYIDSKKLDGFIAVAGTLLLLSLILARIIFLRVRY